MRRALFTAVHRRLRPFSWNWFSSAIPLVPFLFAVVFVVLVKTALDKEILFKMPHEASICGLAGMVLRINMFFLGAIASIVAYFRKGLFPASKKKALEKCLDAMADHISQSTDAEKHMLDDFVNVSRAELNGIWTNLSHVERLFHWGNRALFFLVVSSSTILLHSSVNRSCDSWEWGLAVTLVFVAIFYCQIFTCAYPHWVRNVTMHCIENPINNFKKFEIKFEDLPSEETEFTKRIRELKKPDDDASV